MLNHPCTHILEDIQRILETLTDNLCKGSLHEKINLAYYYETNAQVKSLCQANSCDVQHLALVYDELKIRWQADFRLIATPVSLHPHFN